MAAITVLLSPAVTFGIVGATAEAGTTVALDGDLGRCDFSMMSTVPMEQSPDLGTGSALIHTAGSRAIGSGAPPPDWISSPTCC